MVLGVFWQEVMMPTEAWVIAIGLLTIAWLIVGETFFRSASRWAGASIDVQLESARDPIEPIRRINDATITRWRLLTGPLPGGGLRWLRMLYLALTVLVVITLFGSRDWLGELPLGVLSTSAYIVAGVSILGAGLWVGMLKRGRAAPQVAIPAVIGCLITSAAALFVSLQA